LTVGAETWRPFSLIQPARGNEAARLRGFHAAGRTDIRIGAHQPIARTSVEEHAESFFTPIAFFALLDFPR
jgi:hypothetical protein